MTSKIRPSQSLIQEWKRLHFAIKAAQMPFATSSIQVVMTLKSGRRVSEPTFSA